jgi:isochorismate pyruvate lyase
MTDLDTITTMSALRAQIDALDRDLVALLARRAAMIDRAVVLKPGEGLPARIASRVEEVVAKVRAEAAGRGLDPDLVDRVWRMLIEWSIAREEAVLGPSARQGEGKE